MVLVLLLASVRPRKNQQTSSAGSCGHAAGPLFFCFVFRDVLGDGAVFNRPVFGQPFQGFREHPSRVGARRVSCEKRKGRPLVPFVFFAVEGVAPFWWRGNASAQIAAQSYGIIHRLHRSISVLPEDGTDRTHAGV